MKIKKKVILLSFIMIILVIAALYIYNNRPRDPKKGIPILAYHNIVSDASKKSIPDYINDNYTMSADQFEEQLKYLYDNGYYTITLDELNEWYLGKRELDEKAVVLTFDDGWLSSARLIPNLLKKYGFTGSTFVLVGNMSKTYEEVDESWYQSVSPEDLKDQSIMKFYSHSYHLHESDDNGKPKFESFSKEQIIEDLKKSSKAVSMEYFAYPFGINSKNGDAALKTFETKLAFRFNDRLYAMKSDKAYALPRFGIYPDTTIEEFIRIVSHEYVASKP